MDGQQLVPSIIWSGYGTRAENLAAGIGLIFLGLNFLRNADIGQISHFWMGTDYQNFQSFFKFSEVMNSEFW